MGVKYKEYFDRMIKSNQNAFDEFGLLYNKYAKSQDTLQEEFNIMGKIILKIIHEWENKLCSQTEKGGFGKYSANLSEKFMNEVRKKYPLIDHIGVISKKEPAFNIKKIRL